MPNQHVQNVLDHQDAGVSVAFERCRQLYGENLFSNIPFYNETLKSWMCPAYFDLIYCWPYTLANTVAEIPCPEYVTGFIQGNIATRICTENGTWFVRPDTNQTYTNYSTCHKGKMTTIFTAMDKQDVSDNSKAILPAVKVMCQSGYAVSLISLIIAFAIMFFIKKLHCARNILHMNLFASFILRSFVYILKDILFVEGVGFQADLTLQNGTLYFKTDVMTNNYECKLMTSLTQYFTTANYSWILMEGLYLNNLIFRALFADSSKNLIHYIVLGWGLPLLVVIPWIVARLLLEDTLCWTTNENLWVFLIIGIPTIISVMVNLVLFVIISIVLYTKLRSPINEDSKRYQKWAKSTLVLAPLFGVHYAILLIFYFVGQTTIWLICDTLFGSFQGFFVAILYCFLNGEVKSEVKPHIYSLLSYLATNGVTKHCFPCRQKYLRSAVGRQSVCTTMSCSSLYNNAVFRRNSKPKLDVCPKYKHGPTHQERVKDYHNHINSTRNSHTYNKSSQNSLNLAHYNDRLLPPSMNITNDTSLSAENMSSNHAKPEPHSLATSEEEVRMLGRNF